MPDPIKKDEEVKDESTLEEKVEEKKEEEIKEEELQTGEKLETDTEDRLKKTFETNEPLDKSAESDSKSEDSTPEEKTPADENDSEDGPTPAEKKEEEKLEREEKKAKEDVEKAKDEGAEKSDKKQEDTSQLSDAYFRAATHAGYSEDDVKNLYKSNPELANKTFARMYEAENRLSRQFADIGRYKKDMDRKVAEVPAKPTATEAARESEYKGLDVEQLRRDNPEDPLVDMIVAVEAQSKILYDEVQALKDTRSAQISGQPSGLTPEQQRGIDQEIAAINQQIETFFNADDMKGYADFYGALSKDALNWDAMTPGQKANRWAVIEMMDEIIAGAATLGREVKIDEAMYRAHSSVSEPLREKIIRDDILSKVEKRSKSITLKPSGTVTPESGKPATKQELEDVTAARLEKTFG